MSVKPHDAFRIACSVEELHELLSEFQELVNEAAVELVHDRYADLLAVYECYMIRKKLGMESPNPLKNFMKNEFSLLTSLYYKALDAENKIKRTGADMPAFDFTCDVVIYPHGKHFLLKFLTSQKDYLDILRTNSRFTEYSYDDINNRPKHVSEIEWRQRAETWSSLIKDMSWEHSGYIRKLYTGLKPLLPQKLIDNMNRRYAKEKRLELFTKQIADETGRDTESLRLYIKPLLLKEYTAEMLSEKITKE